MIFYNNQIRQTINYRLSEIKPK